MAAMVRASVKRSETAVEFPPVGVVRGRMGHVVLLQDRGARLCLSARSWV